MFAVIKTPYTEPPSKCWLCRDEDGYRLQPITNTIWDSTLVQVGECDSEGNDLQIYAQGQLQHLYCYLKHTAGGSPVRQGAVGAQLVIIEAKGSPVIVSTMVENDLRPIDYAIGRVIPLEENYLEVPKFRGSTHMMYVHEKFARKCSECDNFNHTSDLRNLTWYDVDYDKHTRTDLCVYCFNTASEILELGECNRCGEIFERDAFEIDEDYLRACSGCNDHYYTCDECGQLVCDDYAHSHEVIRDASFTPRLKFFPDDKQDYYFGFELELETDDEDNTQELAEVVIKRLNKDTAKSTAPFYIKWDGSLDNGFELVSHPATIEWFRESGKLDEINGFPAEFGFRAWDTDTCGFHVHVSRTAFYRENAGRVIYSKAHELRFIALFYRNPEFVTYLAGRASNHYASFSSDEFPTRAEHLRGKIDRKESDKYQVINTRHNNTLEIRIFQGTLRKERILSNLQLVQAGVEYTRNLETAGIENIKNLSSDKFISYIIENGEKYPELLTKVERFVDADSATE